MSSKWIDGFETSRADADLRLRGYLYTTAGTQCVMPPSATGVAGTGLAQIGAAQVVTSPAFSGAAGVMGYWTGYTVNQAWAAGGFSLGVSATANLSAVTGKYYGYAMGSQGGNTAFPGGIAFDGTNYWAIGYNGAAYNLFYSPDLTNWTISPSQPTAMTATSTVIYLGGGIIAVMAATTGSSAYVILYSNNSGTSWATATFPNAYATSGATCYAVAGATGNSTYPHVAFATTPVSNSYVTLAVGSVTGGFTSVVATTTTGTVYAWRPKVLGTVLLIGDNTSVYSAIASSSTLNTSAAWNTATMSIGNVSDVTYNPNSNVYVFATSSGIWTVPNPGTAGTPAVLTGALTATQHYSTVAMTSVYWNSATSLMVAFGASGHVISSPDGLTWTEAGAKILPVGVSGYNYSSSIYDGSRYVVCTDSTTGTVNTSSDGVNNWATTYANHKTPTAASTSSVNGIMAFAVSTTTKPTNPTGTSAVSLSTNSPTFIISPITVSAAGVMSLYVVKGGAGLSPSTVVNTTISSSATTPQSATAYYEIVYVSTATANTFNVSINVNGASVYSASAVLLGSSTTDTTSELFFTPMPSTQQVAQIDDFYFNIIDGNGFSGAQGIINIVARRAETDVQDNWVKNGTASSNSLSTNQPAYSSQSANYVSSNNSGDKDIYSSTDTLPAGYTVKAIALEGVFVKTSTSTPVVSIGLSSGGTESDGSQVTLPTQNTPVFISSNFDKNPNGSVAWTNSTALAAEMVLNHIT
jgi:hypothetical protein